MPQTRQNSDRPEFPTLYKYRSLTGESRRWTEDIIVNDRLWYARASTFNDPFDCNLMIAGKAEGEWEQMFGGFIDQVGEGIRSKATDLIDQAGGEVPALLQPGKKEKERTWEITITDKDGRVRDPAEFFNSHQTRRLARMYEILDESFGVLSLSTKPDDLLMWSHYANRHDGICLEFHPPAHPSAFPRLHPVRYEERYPYLSPHFPDLLAMMHDKKKGSVYRLLLDLARTLASSLDEAWDEDKKKAAAIGIARWFYVKSSHWAYEDEWRALSDGPRLVRFTKRALKGIIVGCVNTEANLEWARKIVEGRRPRIHLYRAVKKELEFGLDIVPAD